MAAQQAMNANAGPDIAWEPGSRSESTLLPSSGSLVPIIRLIAPFCHMNSAVFEAYPGMLLPTARNRTRPWLMERPLVAMFSGTPMPGSGEIISVILEIVYEPSVLV